VADIRSGDVVFWDTRTAKVRARIPAGQLVRSMRFLPDSRRIAIGLNDGEVAIWSLDPPRRLESIKAGPGWLRAITFTPDGRWMMTGSREGRVMLWDLRFIDRGVTALDQPVTDLDFAPDGGTLAAAAMDGTVILRYVTCGRKMLRFRAHDGAVRALRFSPDGSLLATSGANGAVRLWSGRTARKIADLLGHRREVGALAFSPDGKLLASGGARGYVRVWSMNTRMETRRIQFGKGIASLSFHPRGRLLAVAGHEKHVRVFDAETGTRYWESREQIPVLRATFLQNGRLAVQLPMGLLQVHDVETRDPPTTVSRRISAVTIRFGTNDSLWALSAKGPFCSTCGALVLDRTGKATRRAWGHRQSITHMAVHPSGKLVATGAYDNAVKLWRIDDGQEVWRSLLLLDSPPRLYSHQGVVALDTGKITPAEEERGRRWQRAVWAPRPGCPGPELASMSPNPR
jgi:WD40 repeat protein